MLASEGDWIGKKFKMINKNDVGSSLQVQWKPTNAEPQVGAAAPAKSALKHTET